MDYKAYEHALDLGLSESEATRIGEDAWFDSLFDREQEPQVCAACGDGTDRPCDHEDCPSGKYVGPEVSND